MKRNLLTMMGLSMMASVGSAQFCIDGGSSSTADTHLQSVALEGDVAPGIDHTTTCGETGIVDETALSADLTAGSTYDIDVNWGTCGGTVYSSRGSVWIDFNGNETFEATEEIATFEIAFGGTFDLETYSFTVPTDALNGTRRMRIMQQETSVTPLDPCANFTYGSVHDFSVEISGGVDCPPPTEIELNALTPTTAEINWAFIAVEMWQYKLVAEGEDIEAIDYTDVSGLPFTGEISDLIPNTEYCFYVRAVCGEGDTSSVSSAFCFNTPCELLNADNFCEGFEDDSETESCWSVLNVNGDGDTWNLDYEFNPFTGAQSAVIDTDFNGGANDDWLISPHLTLDSPKYLKYWWRVQSDFEPNDFEILLSTTGSDPADFTDTLVALAEYDNEEYMDSLVDLSAFAGENIYIAFHVPDGGLDGWRLYFDEICIVSCPPLTDLALTDIGTTTADFEWLAGLDETAWRVDYGETGFTPGGGSTYTSTTPSTSISGLEPNTEYEIYVSTICLGDGADTTGWVGPLAFRTKCLPFDPALFCEGFEPASETEACWTVIDGNEDGDAWNLGNTFNQRTGLESAALQTDVNAGANDDWLISPNIILTGNEVLSYWSRVRSAFEPNDFEVLLSTTGTNAEDFTDTIVYFAEYANTEYEQTVVNLEDFTGPVYIAFHVPEGGLDGWTLYLDDICIDICNPSEGTDGSRDVCVNDETVDLSTVISGAETFGTWEFAANPLLVDGSTFNVSTLPLGSSFDIEYVVLGGCTNDTTIATINLFGSPNAGEGSDMNVCANQPLNLLAGLGGTVDLGGVWTDEGGVELTTSAISASADGGTYAYTYTVSNGVCGDESTTVNVVVDGDCDYLSLDANALETLSVYPNPTNDVVFISALGVTETFNYEVLDVTGRIVAQGTNSINGSNNVKVDLSNEESGVYMVRVFNATSDKTIRIAKN